MSYAEGSPPSARIPLKTEFLPDQNTSFPFKMSAIDTELTALHARIAHLQEEKRRPPPRSPQFREDLIADKKRVIEELARQRKLSDLARAGLHRHHSEVHILETILESLKSIHARLDALEKRNMGD
jgi:hypothetical protein